MTSDTAQLSSDQKKAAIASMEGVVARAQGRDEEASDALRQKIETATRGCPMQTSSYGRTFIEKYEGLRLAAYPDPGTGGEPYTIGFGHTGGVSPGDTCTAEQADEWLRADLAIAEDAVNSSVTVPLSQNQFDALVSMCYNCGANAFKGSTLLRLLNQGDYSGAQGEFIKWDRGPNGVLPGLLARREAEAAMFASS